MTGLVEVLGRRGRGLGQLLVLDLRRVAVAPADVQPTAFRQSLAEVQLGTLVHGCTRRPSPSLCLRLHFLLMVGSKKNSGSTI